MAELSAVPFSALPQTNDGYTVLYENNQVCRSEKKLSELVGDKTSSFLTKEQGDSLYQEKGDYLVNDDITGKLDKSQYAVDSATFLTAHQDISNKLDTTAFSTVSGNFLTAHQSLDEYATQEWVNNQGFLKEHQPISANEWNDVYETVVTNSGTWGTESDWTDDINAASAYAYEQAIAQIPAPFDPTFLSGEIDKKLDKTFSSNFYPMTGNPSGFLTAHQDLSNYATKTYVNEEVGKVGSYVIATLVNNVPDVQNPSNKKIYLTKIDDATEPDLYKEWIYTETSAWECIGDTSMNLSGYVPLSARNCNIGLDNNCGSDPRADILAQGNSNTATRRSLVQGSTNSAGLNSLVQGQENSASSDAIAQGQQNYAYWQSIAQGQGNNANSASFAQGLSTYASGKSFAQGYNVWAIDYSFSQGENCLASAQSFAQGYYNSATNYSFVQGDSCTATSKSIAQGSDNSANLVSQAFGQGLRIQNSAMAIGRYNKLTNSSNDISFVIGNGVNTNNRSDSFVVYKNGLTSATKVATSGIADLEAKIKELEGIISSYSGLWVLTNTPQ